MEYRAGVVEPIYRYAIWAIIVLIGCVDALWVWWIDIRIVPDLKTLLGLAVLLLINYVYVAIRQKPRIAVLAGAAAQLVAFTAVYGVLTYLAARSSFPLVDRYLSAADVSIGFDWLAQFNWIQGHPDVKWVFNLAYETGTIQIIILLILLNVFGMLERIAEFVWLFVLTLLIIIPFAWLIPAEGAWAYYGVAHLTSAYYLPDFFALRDGTMREIVMDKMTGIVQFPSFHTALALILIFAARGIRFLFPASLGFNALMIASTPAFGGHYLVDIIGGAVLVPLAILIFGWVQQGETKPRPTDVGTLNVVRE
ncbi:phosphatase PAP2 family protein [Bradyrhizobium macuxiense]|nr:phosphatase PAP2 family protein [Bradyrhizobium macuxiense]